LEGRNGPRKIVIVEMLGEIASDVEPAEREFLIRNGLLTPAEKAALATNN
jgi:hypothetical protein